LFRSGAPTKISSDTIDYLLQNLTATELDNAFMLKHSQNGGEFVVLIAGDECIVYDLATGRWHERKSMIGDQEKRWRVNAIVQAYNKIFVWDFQDSRVGILDDQIRTEYGNSVHRYFSTQTIDNKGKYIQVKELLLVADAGFDGVFTMEYSDDGGITWSQPTTRSAGAIGEYGRLIAWERLGTASFGRCVRHGTSTTSQCNVNKLIAA